MTGTAWVMAVAVLVALIAIVWIRRTRQGNEWNTAAAALRLEPVLALDPALTAAIIALHRPPVANPGLQQTWSLTHVYRYPEPMANFYSATVHLEQTGESWRHGQTMRTESRETRIVAVVLPKTLPAPRLQLVPRAVTAPSASPLATMVADVANLATDVAAASGGERLEFIDDPPFDRRYLVLAPQPVPARAFLNATRRQKLSALEDVQVSLDGTLMLVSSPTDAIRYRNRSLDESLKAELEIARRVLTMLDTTQ